MRARRSPELPADGVCLGYAFRDRGLIEAALTHASALPAGTVRSAERLEFLGDAVLDLAVAALLLKAFPKEDEGRLSKRRSALVNAHALAAKARQLGLVALVRLGRGEDETGGRGKPSILGSTYEAVIGAVFLDGGYEAAESLVAAHFEQELRGEGFFAAEDWKTSLQERTQAALRIVPEYILVDERGPAHARHFTVELRLAGETVVSGEGTSKRAAEQQAARSALEGGTLQEILVRLGATTEGGR